MKAIVLNRVLHAAILLALVCAACSKHAPGTPQSTGATDSTKAADTSASMAQSMPAVKELTYEQREGKFSYTKYCAICHGAEGKGDGFNAFNLTPKPKDFTDKQYMQALTDTKLSETISRGGISVNKSVSMPAWGGRLTKLEIGYVSAYVRSFSE
jgi:cytochrome c oxidase cbb3-type subunit III